MIDSVVVALEIDALIVLVTCATLVFQGYPEVVHRLVIHRPGELYALAGIGGMGYPL